MIRCKKQSFKISYGVINPINKKPIITDRINVKGYVVKHIGIHKECNLWKVTLLASGFAIYSYEHVLKKLKQALLFADACSVILPDKKITKKSISKINKNRLFKYKKYVSKGGLKEFNDWLRYARIKTT